MQKVPLLILCLLPLSGAGVIDQNANQLSDVWESIYQAHGLNATDDTDGDGCSNRDESVAGTNPFDPLSKFEVGIMPPDGSGQMMFGWMGNRGKLYTLEHRADLMSGSWSTVNTYTGADAAIQAYLDARGNSGHYRLRVDDTDGDNDGVDDWEEEAVGFDSTTANTDRYRTNDAQRILDALNTTSTLSLQVAEPLTTENWPDPAVFLIRRTGGLAPLTVDFTLGGTATAGSDYADPGTSLTFAPGQTAAWVSVVPVDDGLAEGTEMVVLTLSSSTGYTIQGSNNATVEIHDPAANRLPSAKEAARFLTQATFGPTDALIAEVQAKGFEQWIDDQFNQPMNPLTPILQAYETEGHDVFSEQKMVAWWERAINANDPLRQRIAYALSQIVVISDNSSLEGEAYGMLNYYDMLLANAFDNYRKVLWDVTLHPCMGVYLSHRGNQPPDPALNRFPDENYAREIMQLFSIGLWELNPDGTQKLDGEGSPIPTYTNETITNFARVFTGLSWGLGDSSVWWEFYWPDLPDGTDFSENYVVPMTMWSGPYDRWDSELGQIVQFYFHDQDEKTLLNGTVLPAGQDGMTDLNAGIDNIFNHANVGPFIGRLLIQRLVTSNPSPAYISRVTDAFEGRGPHNPGGVRGDMKAVIKAILLDPEARSHASMAATDHGRLREPFIRYIALARAIGVTMPDGWPWFNIFWIDGQFGQQPMRSPSVFNFYLPSFLPPGELKAAGKTGPEFQITNSVTGITMPNQLLTATERHINRWGGDHPITLDYTDELALVNDTEALLARLSLLLAAGRLSPDLHHVIVEMLERPEFASASDLEKVASAAYLIVSSSEAAVIN